MVADGCEGVREKTPASPRPPNAEGDVGGADGEQHPERGLLSAEDSCERRGIDLAGERAGASTRFLLDRAQGVQAPGEHQNSRCGFHPRPAGVVKRATRGDRKQTGGQRQCERRQDQPFGDLGHRAAHHGVSAERCRRRSNSHENDEGRERPHEPHSTDRMQKFEKSSHGTPRPPVPSQISAFDAVRGAASVGARLGFSWTLGASAPAGPRRSLPAAWIPLESLVRIEPFQEVRREFRRCLFRPPTPAETPAGFGSRPDSRRRG